MIFKVKFNILQDGFNAKVIVLIQMNFLELSCIEGSMHDIDLDTSLGVEVVTQETVSTPAFSTPKTKIKIEPRAL